MLFLPVSNAVTVSAVEALTVIAHLSSVKTVLAMHCFVTGITPWPEIAPLLSFTGVAAITHTVIDQDVGCVVIDSQVFQRPSR